ncbi:MULTISPECIES: DUF6708 domain-containing protein [unclassified Cobetia]|uniref:DUF6708 domain-containing protein n=1 Tax=unclassified Cobetia TaxID=2609414 RepID=UPI00178C86A9|nr:MULTISPECIES: DUF6708 domain-containing protein [unclassified Cobetia]MBE2167850.1 hypothetical protein [Cobetia sp. 2AS1]MDH2446274.1 hypothetical protein [Cobetia sp. 2AS]
MNIEKYLRVTGMIKKGEYPDIEIPVIKKGERIKSPPQSIFYIDKSHMILGDTDFRERGRLLGASFLYVPVIVTLCSIFAYFMFSAQAYFYAIFQIFFAIFVFHPFILGAWFEVKKDSVYPVVFNRETSKVYFFSNKDYQPKEMAWQDCLYAVAYKGRSITACQYELRGFLMDDFRVEDSFSFGDTILEMREAPKNEVFYLFYYIQSFMEYDDEFEIPPTLMSWRPSLAESARHTIPRLITDNSTINFLSTVFYRSMCVFFSWQILGHYLICRYGKIPQWSQEIIDECGEDIILK